MGGGSDSEYEPPSPPPTRGGVIPNRQKYEILLELLDGKRQSQVILETGLHRCVVYRIWRNRDKLYQKFNPGKKCPGPQTQSDNKSGAVGRYISTSSELARYKCRICLKILEKKFLVAKHIAERHAHNEAEAEIMQQYLLPQGKKACMDESFDWKPNPDNLPWEEINLTRVNCSKLNQVLVFPNDPVDVEKIEQKIEARHHFPYVRLENMDSKNTENLPLPPGAIKTEGERWFCPICDKEFSSRQRQLVHQKIHNARLPCPHCHRVFRGKSYLKYHLVQFHADKPDVRSDPQFDEMVKKRAGNLERRRANSKVYIKPLKLRCPQCPKLFPWASVLNRHIRAHEKDKPYVCDVCQVRYKHQDQLKRHKEQQKCESVIERMAERPFKCRYCMTMLKNEKSRGVHERDFHGIYRRTDSKKYICIFCGYDAKSHQNFLKHNRSHTGEKPFGCDACGKFFSVRGNLIKHVKVHCQAAREMGFKLEVQPRAKATVFKGTEEDTNTNSSGSSGQGPSKQLIKCSLCEQTFNSQYKRSCHERSHGDNYFCPFCPAGFFHPMGLSIHKMKAHKEKMPSFECRLCGETFKTLSGYTVHRITHRVGRDCPSPKVIGPSSSETEEEVQFGSESCQDNPNNFLGQFPNSTEISSNNSDYDYTINDADVSTMESDDDDYKPGAAQLMFSCDDLEIGHQMPSTSLLSQYSLEAESEEFEEMEAEILKDINSLRKERRISESESGSSSGTYHNDKISPWITGLGKDPLALGSETTPVLSNVGPTTVLKMERL